MAGTDQSRAPVLGGPVVILVEPQLPPNIGAVARAMLNFGLEDLRLVRPREGWPQAEARAMASRADRVLDRAEVFDSVAAAIGDRHIVHALSARPRDMAKPVLTPRRSAELLRAAQAAGQRVGLIFGPERAGLDNDDLSLAQALVRIPANPAFASLNLAQAVLLMAHEWFQAAAPVKAEVPAGDLASQADLVNFQNRLEAALDAAGFFRPPEKRPHMVRNLRNVFQRAGLSDQEVRTLHGVLSALDRHAVRRARDR